MLAVVMSTLRYFWNSETVLLKSPALSEVAVVKSTDSCREPLTLALSPWFVLSLFVSLQGSYHLQIWCYTYVACLLDQIEDVLPRAMILWPEDS